MNINIDYGRTGIPIHVPDRNLKAILSLQPMPPIPDPAAAVQDALQHPTGTRSLPDLAKGARSACILVCDATRPVPNQVMLPPILDALATAGIPRASTQILIATGLHRGATPVEILEILGPSIPSAYTILNHNARRINDHVYLGETRTGAPILIDRRYAAAGLKIATGLIEPHLMAGFSGGRKLICPGIAATGTIRHFHSLSILDSPAATAGTLEGNPVSDFSFEVARIAGCDFTVNTALDENRQITGVFAGDILEAWMQGVDHVRKASSAPLSEEADIVITSGAGHPLDGTLYQSIKGLVAAMPAVKPGGTIILFAAMQEGIGSPDFESLLSECAGPDDFLNRVKEPGFFRIDQWQTQELARVRNHANIIIYSPNLQLARFAPGWLNPALSPAAAIAAALDLHGRDATIVVIPKGPYVLPTIERS